MVEYAALLPPYKKLDIKRVLQNIIMRKILLLNLNLMAVTLRVVMRENFKMPTQLLQEIPLFPNAGVLSYMLYWR